MEMVFLKKLKTLWWLGYVIPSLLNLFVMGGVLYTLIKYDVLIVYGEATPVTFEDLPAAFYIMAMVLLTYTVVLFHQIKTERMTFGRFLILYVFYFVMSSAFFIVFATGTGLDLFMNYFIDFFGIYRIYELKVGIFGNGYYTPLIILFAFFFLQLVFFMVTTKANSFD